MSTNTGRKVSGGGKQKKRPSSRKTENIQDCTPQEVSSLEDISRMLEKLQFRKHFGGVDEQDVWEKIGCLDEMYRKVFFIQEQKYRLLLGMKRREKGIHKDVSGGTGDE